MNDRIMGVPLYVWAVGMVAGIYGFLWMRRRGGQTSSTPTGTPAGQPVFTQAQEVQDFQIFSALTGQQQGSDLNFLSEVASLFAGGASGGTTTPASTPAQTAPANTGGTIPATTQASPAAGPAPVGG